MKLLVYYTRFTEALPQAVLERQLGWLSAADRDKNARYRRWQDQHAHLLGRLLLLHAYAQLTERADFYNGLTWDAHGKPGYSNSFHFNVAHSGNYVLCAVSQNGACGVDVEAIKPIDLKLMDRYFTPAEWEDIQQRPIPRFYHYWTRKEAVIKANGKGLSLPLVEVDCQANNVAVDGATWHLSPLVLDAEHCAHAATVAPVSDLALRELQPDLLG